jgi:hypothetical protein
MRIVLAFTIAVAALLTQPYGFVGAIENWNTASRTA